MITYEQQQKEILRCLFAQDVWDFSAIKDLEKLSKLNIIGKLQADICWKLIFIKLDKIIWDLEHDKDAQEKKEQ